MSIIKENGLRYAKLIHVSVDNGKTDNSNKVYIMEELADGRIKCEYGRVGKSMATVYKGSHEWDKIIREKTSNAKGYTDVTDLQTELVVDDSQPKDDKVEAIKDSIVRKLVEELMAFANKSIQRNYKVTQEAVSEQQVNAAQEVLDKISGSIKIGVDIKDLNNYLLKLYTIIPRRMDNVKNHLFREINDNEGLSYAQRLLDSEQSALDTMAGQVQLIKQQREAATEAVQDKAKGKKSKSLTILEQMGLTIEVENDKETLDLITKLMGSNASQLKKVYKVRNLKTQAKFDTHMAKVEVKKKRLYWHGSRNENIFNLLQSGMLLRPNGVVTNGKMFGWGLYQANKAQKSIGYTSLSGSYWARGSENKGFLLLNDVHIGNQKHIYNYDSSCKDLNYQSLQKEGFDSVYAHGGYDLRNDEFIVYNEAQVTISHLIEISS